jgi:hypothetical protein
MLRNYFSMLMPLLVIHVVCEGITSKNIPAEIFLDIYKEEKKYMKKELSLVSIIIFNSSNIITYLGILTTLYVVKDPPSINLQYKITMPLAMLGHMFVNLLLIYILEYYKAKIFWLFLNNIFTLMLIIGFLWEGQKYSNFCVGALVITSIINNFIICLNNPNKKIKTDIQKLLKDIQKYNDDKSTSKVMLF